MEREGKSTPDHGKRGQPVRLGDLLSSIIPSPASRTESDRPRELGADDRTSELEARTSTVQEKRSEIEFYSELNLNRFPFASLWDKDTGKAGTIVVRRTIHAGQTTSVLEWIVTPSEVVKSESGLVQGGLPGPLDRRVFRALEKIVLGRTLKKGEPLSNPQPIEVKEILETLDLTVQTLNYRSVVRALTRLLGTKISCSGLVKAKEKTPSKGVIFSPISEIRWVGDTDPDSGLRINKTQIYFAPFYLDSVNSFNVRPIDWDLWRALSARPLAQRLYEILEMGFFGLKDSRYTHFTYSELCSLLPTRPQAKPSDARKILDRAHEALKMVEVVREGKRERLALLESVEWTWDGPDASLRYFPNREYLARLRARRTPEFDPRALELAREFNDMDSLAFYQLIVRKVDWQYVSAARTEVRSNRSVRDPRKYFTATLRKILAGVGASIPFGS